MPEDEDIISLATNETNPNFANSGIKNGSNMGAQGDAGVYIPPPKKKDLNFERGITFQYPFSTQYHNLWEMWKTDKVSVKQLEVMRRTDGHARALYRAITLPILACLKTATIAPISGVEGGQDEANFIDLMLHLPPAAGGMTVTLNQFMRQILLGTFHGFSAFEMVYWVPKKGPLAGKITLRKASYRPADSVHFLSNDQGEFAGWRQRIFLFGRYIDVELPNETALVYTCFTGGTKVALLDGRNLPIAEVVERVASGEELWTYSVDADQNVVAGRISYGRSMGRKKVVRVTLDSGESVRCTPDHKWMLRDGSYKQAQHLTAGDSLMPLYRKDAPVGRSKKLYEQVYVPSEKKYKFTHRVVADALYGPGKTGWVTHHVDVNDHNNNPTNLVRITSENHWQLHKDMADKASKVMKAKWADPVWRAEVGEPHMASLNTPEVQERAHAWAKSEEGRATASAWMKENAKHTRRDITLEVLTDLARKYVTCAEAADHLDVHVSTINNKLKAEGINSWKSLRKSLGSDAAYYMTAAQVAGHEKARVFELEDAAGLIRAGVTSGIRVADSLGVGTSTVYKRVKDSGYGSWRAFVENSLLVPNNHKVVSVEFLDEEEEVFDITVDHESHNFALASGVFARNCNAEEGPIYGVSMFESAFWHYDKKVKLYYLAHLAAQKGALGTRIGTMPPNPNKADKDHFLRALNELGVKQYMAMPIDWTVTSLQEAGKFDFLPLIEHHNQMMSESVLCNSVLDSNGGGTNAPMVDFSSNDDTLFIQMLESIMDDIASVINNQLIPRFIDWNFGTGLYPQFRWGPFTDEQKDAIRLAFNSLAMAPQINLAPEMWQALQQKWGEDLGINIDYDILQKEWTEKNQQQDALDSLNYQTQLIQAHTALEMAANPPPVDPLTGQPVQPGATPSAQPVPKPAAPAKSASPQPAPAGSPSTPGQKTQVTQAKKAGPDTKIAKAKTAAAGTHTAAKKAANAAKQNSGNPNPSQGAKQLSPKSAAQKEQARKQERARGH